MSSRRKNRLDDRSSRPRRTPRQPRRRDREAVDRLRKKRMVPAGIAVRSGLARFTVARRVRKAGWGRPKSLEPLQPARGDERRHLGQLLHLDIEKRGRVDGIGHRIPGDQRHRARGIGWEWIHVRVDDASRLAQAEILADERQRSAVLLLTPALRGFHRQAVQVEALITESGSSYTTHAIRSLCRQLGLGHIYTRPYRPQINGKAVRFIQATLRECLIVVPTAADGIA